jgi:RNA polymerase sigma factor (sigma-70 family)
MSKNKAGDLIAEIYRRDYARLVAVLARIFGVDNIDLVEDTLQDAFSKALEKWQLDGIPQNPEAWIVLAAKNRTIDLVRANKNKLKLAPDLAHFLESEWSLRATVDQQFSESKIQDDQLRMMFACCATDTSAENQIPLVLQLLCGLDIGAISRALLIPVATVKKRLLRTKQALKQQSFEVPEGEKLQSSLSTVHTVIYLLFNEGFHGTKYKEVFNELFCLEALGLVRLLIEAESIASRETYALYALMHYLMARFEARLDREQQLVSLDQQDRSLWDALKIAEGDRWLELAQNHDGEVGRFTIEALIASEHCHAESFQATRWGNIVLRYNELIAVTQSPLAVLNQAVAIAYAGNVELAIAQVERIREHKAFKKSHLPDATLAHLFAKAKNQQSAHAHAEAAKNLGGSESEHKLMLSQIERILAEP